jgi:hypothetical protein
MYTIVRVYSDGVASPNQEPVVFNEKAADT